MVNLQSTWGQPDFFAPPQEGLRISVAPATGPGKVDVGLRRHIRHCSKFLVPEQSCVLPSEFDALPAVSRLALAYAPRAARAQNAALLVLDARLAAIVRSAREPMLAQLRLAWWRETLGRNPEGWPSGEPLLTRLATWGRHASRLTALVGGWEGLVAGARLDAEAIEQFAGGRSIAWAALADVLGIDGAQAATVGRQWALADLAARLSQPGERELARAIALAQPWRSPRLPRALRPLVLLHGLGWRALCRDSELLDGPAALALALRLGLAGR